MTSRDQSTENVLEIPATTSEPSISDELAAMMKCAEHIKHNHDKLVQAAERTEKRLAAEAKALEETKAKFAETKAVVEDALDKCKGRVKLNVGGVKYETTLTTLTADGDESMLGSMFSGRHALVTNDEGEVFIDRDGTHFGLVLNVLRDTSVVVLAKDRSALSAELQYLGISNQRCKRLIKIVDANGNVCRSWA